MRTIRNEHQRVIAAPAAAVGALLDRLAAADDPLWPAPAWPAVRLDRPLGPGAAGGHGPIRYRVEEYEPGVRVRFGFSLPGTGYHEFSVRPVDSERCLLRHRMETNTPGLELLTWPLAIRWIHDAVLEELLDNAEYAVGQPVPRPARWSPWVRLLNRVLWDRPRKAEPELAGRLAGAALDRVDFADAYRMRLHPAMPAEPETWAAAVLRPPPTVRALLRLRQALVRPFGIRREPDDVDQAFPVTARDDREVVRGTDAPHLDFRLAVLTDGEAVTATTATKLNNRRGRAYFAVVRLFHGPVVRAMLRRAHREIALGSTPGARARAARVTPPAPPTGAAARN